MDTYPEPLGNIPLKWPYPVHYGEENEVVADVLVIGCGVAGSFTAIHAARKGAKVIVVDKAPISRSGSAGAGIDHWHDACTNPCCTISPEEMVESGGAQGSCIGGFPSQHVAYIACKESYDALLDFENMGIEIRDVDDEFAGAEFRDEETKLLFAYDYDNKHTIRLRGGANLKAALYNELKRLGVAMYEHTMTTSLLTEGGKTGARVVGATGVNVRTGEFYIFKAKATVMSAGGATRIWIFSSELKGSNSEHKDPNNTGDGFAMAWRAGAEFALMERSAAGGPGGPFGYPAYGAGNAHNTWFACSMVDADGKEVPWVDRDGRVLKTVSERYHPAPGQKFFVLMGPQGRYEHRYPYLIPDLNERIRKGEYKLPLYADLSSMPEHERRAIFGLMVGNEGKTRIAIYDKYTGAGFDPDKDMLQAHGMGAGPTVVPQWRFFGAGGLMVDWDLRTNLEGLYVAGSEIAGFGGCAGSSAAGRYVGRKVAAYAREAAPPVIDRKQIDAEKKRVYAPVKQKDGIGWKELQAGICRIMQDYCGEYKTERILRMGLWWLNSIRESEAARACARNPHELWRTLECLSRLTVGEIIMHACLARKASSAILGFNRLDYPEVDPPEWMKFVTVRQEGGEVEVGELPLDYWRLPPNAPGLKENYGRHCSL